jgi:hypothetical protein
MFSEYVDTREGLLEGLTSLEALNKLAHERHMFGYAYGQRMDSWTIGGRWILDSYDNIGRLGIGHLSPQEIAALDLPPVLGKEEFELELESRGLKNQAFLCDLPYPLPPSESKCPRTDTVWTVENAHLAKKVQVADFEWVEDDRWIGHRWGEISYPEVMSDGTTVRISPTTIVVKGVDGMVRNLEMRGDRHVPYGHIILKGEALQFSMVCYVHVDSCTESEAA